MASFCCVGPANGDDGEGACNPLEISSVGRRLAGPLWLVPAAPGSVLTEEDRVVEDDDDMAIDGEDPEDQDQQAEMEMDMDIDL
eukprot:1196433-Prorocentrum_minimum.AAC.1